ncbi:MAG TPA: NAD(+) synthase [Planctomycetaceae bacterium]|nr:NAD(+) synthase [Planctomycetaceae bacterium]
MTAHPHPFDSLYAHGFARVAVCVPRLRVADPGHNADRTLALARAAAGDHAALVLFPELGLSAYSNEDLFHQDALLDAAEAAVERVVAASGELAPVLLVGAPWRSEGKLFNCAFVIHRGRVLGVVPKSYLPNYREFYEKRQFSSGWDAVWREVRVLGETVPFGNDLIFTASDLVDFALHVEICEDVWSPLPPSTFAALAGATVLANLSASNITVGKAAYRRDLCASQSGKCLAAYLYAAAGPGESTTDLAWDGHALIYENNHLLAESDRFSLDEQRITADVDLDRLRQERMRMTSFTDTASRYRDELRRLRRIPFELGVPAGGGPVPLRREVERFPYVPGDPAERDERCYEAYNIQVTALVKRLEATGIQKAVIGVSGGLDSTQALIVACRAMDRLGWPRKNVLGFTMPGFATTEHTRSTAWTLMKTLGVTAAEIDVRPSCRQMLADISHPAARGEPVYDTTFENVQAGERTSHLFRLANQHGGLVVGTGDLSELALGWCTYGVGDQMSHYHVNASVPKTLVQHLIRWVIDRDEFGPQGSRALQEVLDTEISPELVPGGESAARPAQRTEDVIGPYELQDFNLYYISRFGFRPGKVAYLAHHAWGDRARGPWPPGFPADERREYDLATIKKWLRVFLDRFFRQSQFKRSAQPNAPKVGSGGSLSPRGDWRAPSDAVATAWLEELDRNVPDE